MDGLSKSLTPSSNKQQISMENVVSFGSIKTLIIEFFFYSTNEKRPHIHLNSFLLAQAGPGKNTRRAAN